jgi:hypothetical protein
VADARSRTYQIGRERLAVDEQGLAWHRPGRGPVEVPWAVIGMLRVEEVEHGPRPRRVLRAHLSDGRTLELPAPVEAGEVLKAWRASFAARGRPPHDAMPADYRRAVAHGIDLGDVVDGEPAPAPAAESRVGGVYRSGLSRAVVDEAGVTITRPFQARLRIPWQAVRSVTAIETSGMRLLWMVRVRLHDRRVVLLPAPSSRAGEQDPDFQRALGEITAALRASRPAAGELADRIERSALREAAADVALEEGRRDRRRE